MNSDSLSSIDMFSDKTMEGEGSRSDEKGESQSDAHNAHNSVDEDSNAIVAKVLVVGDYAVGKSSLIRRYCTGQFKNSYIITIGVDFCMKKVQSQGKEIQLQLWDIAGHERFSQMLRVFLRGGLAALVCFDISRPSTLDNVKKWRDNMNDKVELPNGKPIPMVLLATKCDLPDISIDKEKMDKFARENGFIAWFETSSKTNTGINEAMDYLTQQILKISRTMSIQSSTTNAGENNFKLVDDSKHESVSHSDTDEKGDAPRKKCCKT